MTETSPLKKFGVGFYSNPKSKSALNNHILFPIQNAAGQLVAYAWRTTGDDGQRYCFPPAEKFNRGLELWNFHRALEEKAVVVVEGFFGAMNPQQNGYAGAVALMGSNVSEQQPELIADHFQSATFLIDPDEAGRKLARQAVDLLHGRIFLKLLFPAMQADQMTADDMKRVFDSFSIQNGGINGNGNLAAAMTLLIQTQAQFVHDLAETRREFAAIRQDLDTIKAVLVRHETMLEKLSEAIRDKIGFKQ